MAIQYQESVIRKHAERLYDRATAIVALYALLGLVLGGVGGVSWLGRDPGMAIVVALVGGALGAAVGRARSFEFKLRAQVALCQVEIERHTRQTAMMSTAAPGRSPNSAGLTSVQFQ